MSRIIATIFVGMGLVILASFVLKDMPASNSWLALDNIFHFFGGVFAAWCGWLIVGYRRWQILMIAVVIGLGWELAEHISSVYGPSYWPTVYPYYHAGSTLDTIDDLVADIFGTLCFILLYCRNEK